MICKPTTWKTLAVAFAATLVASVSVDAEPLAADPGPKELESDSVLNYCLNISSKAEETRLAQQVERLKALQVKLDVAIGELERRRLEVQGWVERQKELQDAAEGGLVEIYATMDPEAAAEQLSTLDIRIASSVIRRLKPRIASGILNEMKPQQAAELVRIIAAATATEPTKAR